MTSPATSRLKVNPPVGSPPTLEWQSVDKLDIDPIYQRATTIAASQSLIRRIAQFWDWGLCQPLAVARRADGALMVVDGQHRLEAARLRKDIPHLPCVITSYENEGDEAAAFVALNQQRRPLSKLDLFRAALAAEDNDALAITSALGRSGLMLASHSNYTVWKPGMVANIGGIQQAWTAHGQKVVGPAFQALAAGFHGQILRYAGTIFPGIVGLLVLEPAARTGPNFDRLVKALASKSQVDWRREIMTQQGLTGERRERAAKTVILKAFLEQGTVDEDSPAAVEGFLEGIPTVPSAPQAPPSVALPTDMAPAEMAWCNQCDQRVSGAKSARCTDQFCSLKVKAA